VSIRNANICFFILWCIVLFGKLILHRYSFNLKVFSFSTELTDLSPCSQNTPTGFYPELTLITTFFFFTLVSSVRRWVCVCLGLYAIRVS
jgi:hypothetical protein